MGQGITVWQVEREFSRHIMNWSLNSFIYLFRRQILASILVDLAK